MKRNECLGQGFEVQNFLFGSLYQNYLMRPYRQVFLALLLRMKDAWAKRGKPVQGKQNSATNGQRPSVIRRTCRSLDLLFFELFKSLLNLKLLYQFLILSFEFKFIFLDWPVESSEILWNRSLKTHRSFTKFSLVLSQTLRKRTPTAKGSVSKAAAKWTKP